MTDGAVTRLGIVAGYGRLWRRYVRTHRWRLFLAVGLMAVVAAITAGYAKFVQVLIAAMEARDTDLLIWTPVLIIMLTVAKGVAMYYQLSITNAALSDVEADMQADMYRALVHTDIAHLQSEPPAEISARFSADIGAVRLALGAILMGLANIVIVVATFAMMLTINWMLTLGLIVIFLLSVWPVHAIGRRVNQISRDVQARIARMTGDVHEGLSGIRLVRTYQLEDRLLTSANGIFDRLRRDKIKVLNWQARVEPVMEVLGGLALAGLLALVTWQMMNGSGSLADFMGLLTGLAVASTPARRLGATYTEAQRGLAAMERVTNLIDRKNSVTSAENAVIVQSAAGALSFRDVSFSYPDGTTALRNLTLDIKPGQKIAFVGRSGAGKSTVFNLLPRLYDPTAGEILLDGVNIRDISLDSLRAQIAVVSQDSTLLTGTIVENIAFGNAGATWDQVAAAAVAAEADGFIRELKQGYDTPITPSENSFSGGEKQRLAIARAILRDAPILMLDEPTSALDAKSEDAIRTALSRLSTGRTTLVIAHRLSTIMDSDMIVVMDNGQVVDTGRHEELLARGGIYADLYALQFGASRP